MSAGAPPAGAFVKAYGWGVSDGASKFEICTSTCQAGQAGGGAGQLYSPTSVATDPSGDVYVAELVNNRLDEFSAAGAFVKAYGWGVSDGASQFETCTGSCRAGLAGGGAGQLDGPYGVVTHPSGDVYVADQGSNRIDEFSAAGAFVKAYGWGVSDGASQFETCVNTCQAGQAGGGAGQLYSPTGIATDPSGDVYVADQGNQRIDEFSAAGAFVEAYGWGVSDGASKFETCTSGCRAGLGGGGAGQLASPTGIATDRSGDVYVGDHGNVRIDEFSAAGAFVEAYGWGVSDGASRLETCTGTCQAGIAGGGTGQLDAPIGVATDPSGDVYVADSGNQRIDEFTGSVAPPVSEPCVVPNVERTGLAKAKRAIKSHDCRVGTIKHAFSAKVKKGHVISQKPKPQKRLKRGAKVNLVVSKGAAPALVSPVPAKHYRIDRAGLVFGYYGSAGWRFQPLLSFARLNQLLSSRLKPNAPAQRLVRALLARSRRRGDALYWDYGFAFGGPRPWTSGFTQAIAAQALARAGQTLEDPSLLDPAGAAFRGLRQTLLLHVGGGLWIREYGFTRQVILNSQLQSLLSLESYARIVAAPAATRLVGHLYRTTVRLLPRFDLGCHSLYQLGGPVADRHYQDYHVALLHRLAAEHPDQPIWRHTWARWRRCA